MQSKKAAQDGEEKTKVAAGPTDDQKRHDSNSSNVSSRLGTDRDITGASVIVLMLNMTLQLTTILFEKILYFILYLAMKSL